MSGKRITMRKIRDILRLRHEGNLSIRQIRASTKVSVGAVQKLLSRAETLQLGWPLDPALTDNQLARLFYPEADTRASRRFQVPDWAVVHQELKRKGMTKQLLWEEYTEQYPNRCYSYSQFCDRYRHWHSLQKGTDKLTRRPGLALLDRDLSPLYVDASAHSERVLRSKDARRSHISEQK